MGVGWRVRYAVVFMQATRKGTKRRHVCGRRRRRRRHPSRQSLRPRQLGKWLNNYDGWRKPPAITGWPHASAMNWRAAGGKAIRNLSSELRELDEIVQMVLMKCVMLQILENGLVTLIWLYIFSVCVSKFNKCPHHCIDIQQRLPRCKSPRCC